ncbi:SH3 domain-containing protein [Aureivirga sp. CE67]|uniref:SH3 domain-containing protein n=1 Tax=Aureivirga sp. CE67 TaxID=1788983 RepID=UPI0018CA7139|nr:SH3 domain-containing protein [Aureivirga sp. CE67]
MKQNILILTAFFLFFLQNSYAQNKSIVTAFNGLVIRDAPSLKSNKIGKFYFGKNVGEIKNTGETLTITDEGKEISGEWLEVKNFDDKFEKGYVFSGFLGSNVEFDNKLKEEILKTGLFEDFSSEYLHGDFFGDGISDYAFILKEKNEDVSRLVILNIKKKNEIIFVNKENSTFEVRDYSWAGIFELVGENEPLWSNYEDDFIEFANVPDNKKVYLNYNALYLHATESCGGGFIFWKNGKFQWLQQE